MVRERGYSSIKLQYKLTLQDGQLAIVCMSHYVHTNLVLGAKCVLSVGQITCKGFTQEVGLPAYYK